MLNTYRTRRALVFGLMSISFMVFGIPSLAQNPLNTYAITSLLNGVRSLVFVDTTTGRVAARPLPAGMTVGIHLCRTPNGDVWIEDGTTNAIHRFTAQGQYLLTIAVPSQIGYILSRSNGNIVVIGLLNNTSFFVDLYEYDPNGAILRRADLGATLGTTLTGWMGVLVNVLFERAFEDRNGVLWMHTGIYPHIVIRVDPSWTNAVSYTWFVGSLLPDADVGVAVSYTSNTASMPGFPTAPTVGTLGLDLQGVPTWISGYGGYGTPSAVAVGNLNAMNRERVSFRTLGSPTTNDVWIRQHPAPPGPCAYCQVPTSITTLPSFALISGNTGIAETTCMDGEEDAWVTHTSGNLAMMPLPYAPFGAEYRLLEISGTPPYGVTRSVFLGSPPMFTTILGGPWRGVSTEHGTPTLHLLANATDPDSDYDADGIPNGTELGAGSNPFDAKSPDVRVLSLVSAAPGGVSYALYQLPGETGFPYFAPFSMLSGTTSLPGGRSVPFLFSDPVVQESLLPASLFLAGTWGYIDTQEQAFPRVFIPADPSLSGLSFWSSIVTFDPANPLLVRRVSVPLILTIP